MSEPNVLNDARRLLRRGALVEAEQAARRALEGGADPAAAHELLGAVYLEQRRPELAVRAASTAVRLDPDNGAAYRHLARAHQLLGHRQAALEALWSGIERRPRELACYFEAAVLLREGGALEQAVEVLNLAAERIPAAAGEIDHLRLELLLAERCWQAARRQAEDILAVRPHDVRALDALSMTHYQLGDLPASVAATRRLVAVAPLLPDYPLRLAMLYRETGELGRAVALYETVAAGDHDPEVTATALDALAAIDAAQLPAALVLASESSVFLKSLLADPVGAARDRGFCLSHEGLAQLMGVLASADHHATGRTPRH